MTIETYSIQQISKMANVSKHTLRFWERELEGIIVPLRTGGGQRRYTPYHLFVVEEIKKLKKKGLSLLDIKKILDNNQKGILNIDDMEKINSLANQIAETVKSTLYNFFERENIQKKM